MTREYDARSRPATPKFRENYDQVFRKAKQLRKARSKRRGQPPVCGFCGLEHWPDRRHG